MTIDSGVVVVGVRGAAPAADATPALHPQMAAELAQEVGLLTRTLFAQLRSVPAIRTASPETSTESMSRRVATPVASAWSVDDQLAIDVPTADDFTATGELVVQQLLPPDPSNPSPALGDAPPAWTSPTAGLPVLDLPALDVSASDTTTGQFMDHESAEDCPPAVYDDEHLDEGGPDVRTPRLAHLRDLRVLDEIRFLED